MRSRRPYAGTVGEDGKVFLADGLQNISAYSSAPERCDQLVGRAERARSQLRRRHRPQHPDPIRSVTSTRRYISVV
jgi:hypothetical protein